MAFFFRIDRVGKVARLGVRDRQRIPGLGRLVAGKLQRSLANRTASVPLRNFSLG